MENPIPNSKPFQKGQSGNPNGRPRKLIKHINKELKDDGFEQASNEDIKGAYMTLLNLPLSKIKQIASLNNDEYPLLYKLVAKEMTGKRGMEMLEKVLDRAIGKAQQSIDHTTKGNEINNRPQIIFTDESKGKPEVSEDLED